jgi:hypothetical protein
MLRIFQLFKILFHPNDPIVHPSIKILVSGINLVAPILMNIDPEQGIYIVMKVVAFIPVAFSLISCFGCTVRLLRECHVNNITLFDFEFQQLLLDPFLDTAVKPGWAFIIALCLIFHTILGIIALLGFFNLTLRIFYGSVFFLALVLGLILGCKPTQLAVVATAPSADTTDSSANLLKTESDEEKSIE